MQSYSKIFGHLMQSTSGVREKYFLWYTARSINQLQSIRLPTYSNNFITFKSFGSGKYWQHLITKKFRISNFSCDTLAVNVHHKNLPLSNFLIIKSIFTITIIRYLVQYYYGSTPLDGIFPSQLRHLYILCSQKINCVVKIFTLCSA